MMSVVPLYAKLVERSGDGVCYQDKFAYKLGLKPNASVIRLFEMFDTVCAFEKTFFEVLTFFNNF